MTTKSYMNIPEEIRAIQANPPLPMVSFHGSAALKQFYLDRVRAHQKADEIVRGVFWEEGKGCAVGCTLHSSEHAAYKRELGLPEWLARLEDTLFEGMANDKAKSFPLKFLEVIPVGVKLESVKWKFCSFLMADNLRRVDELNDDSALETCVKDALRQAKNVHDNAISTKTWDKTAADTAMKAALSAADTARAQARALAVQAARASELASAAVRVLAFAESLSAACLVADAVAWSSWSEPAAYSLYAEKLLEMLAAA